jgi:hypothetical protein
MNRAALLGFTTGLLAGGLIGLFLGQSTRKSIADNITTTVDGGRVIVAADLGQAARQGVANLFR